MTLRKNRWLLLAQLATVVLVVSHPCRANASEVYDDFSQEGTIEEIVHFPRSTPESDSYVVSVVEFHPEPMTMPIAERTEFHIREYSKLIRSPEAKPADIIVFPELTLNSLSDTVFVPDPDQRVAPCDDHGTILVTLSCLAREVRKYLVINLSEQFYVQHQAKTLFYNTDVVFDRDGTVIARYRKFNLFKEPGTSVTPLPELVSFETDFGVNFGVFTCFDILFALPTLELIKHGLRDFVFPAFWTSEPPFLTSTQIFESWAYANNANLIVAGTNYGPSGATGTGVFNGRNGALLTHYTGVPTRALYTVTVPKSGSGNITRYHSLTSDVLEVPIAEPSDHRLPGEDYGNIRIGRDFLEQFTTIQLNPIWQQETIGQIVCNGMFCCDFSLSLSVDDEREKTHYYRLAVFDGVRTFQGFADAHVSICGVIACGNQSIASCGRMLESNSEYLQFNSISITGQFIANGTLAMPSTLDMRMYSYDASHYRFTANVNYSSNSQIVSMNLTTPISNMQTFGIYAFNHKEFEFYNPIDLPGANIPQPDEDDDDDSATLGHAEIQQPEKDNQNNTGKCVALAQKANKTLEHRSPDMIANDLFRQLSCGAKFTSKNKLPIKRKLDSVDAAAVPNVKVCLKAETDDDDEPNVILPVGSKNVENATKQTEIKSEPESDASESEQPQRNRKSKGSKKNVMDAEKIEQQNVIRLNKLRKEFKIHVKKSRYSPEVPNIIETFDQLSTDYGVTSRLVSNIVACYSTPTPVQMQAIPVLMKSISLHAYAPTGSGKTAAFLIPILHHLKKPMKCGFRALIICPTRELAKQIQREALRLGDEMNLRTHVIQTVDDPKKSDYSFSSGRSYDILVATPNRICYLLSQNPPKIDLSNIQWVVIDEADKLFEDSKNSFREQLDTVITACNNPAKTIALFSATQTREVNEWVARNIPSRIRFSVGLMNGAVELVEQKLLFTGTESGKLLAFRELVAQGLHPPVLLFVQSKDRAQQLFTELIYDGLNVDVIHSDRTQRERDNVVRAFREGKIWILICTELMSRGIDFKGVNLVVNYDFPPSTISYVHRIGRTGRAGRPGKAVTFFTKDDTVNLKSIAHLIKSAGGEVPEYMLQLHGSSKKARDNLARKAPKRAAIRTLPTFEFQQLQRKKRFVSKSKGKPKPTTNGKDVKSKKIVKKSVSAKQRSSKQ